MRPWPGTPYPLGATYDGVGTNFALFSEVAEYVELCLFDEDGTETRVRLPEVDGFVHHGYLLGVGPGAAVRLPRARPVRPGSRPAVQPEQAADRPVRQGHLDGLAWDEALFGYKFGSPDERNDADSAPYVPKSVVVNPFFDWANDRLPQHAVQRDASSTRRTSAASPSTTRRSRRGCAAPTRASRTR